MKTSNLLRPSGIFIFIMTAIWALPFAVRTVAAEPLEFKSHLYHVAFFGIPVITSVFLNLNKKIMEKWSRNGIWSRIIIICCGYAASAITTVLIVMDWGFYGGDAGGSYALFLLPSIAVYAVIGLVVGLFMYLLTMYQKAKDRSIQEDSPDRKAVR